VVISKAAQAIDFPALAAQAYSPGATIGVSARALFGATPTGLLVTFTASGSCTVSSSTLAGANSTATVTLTGAGTCTLTANQAGTTNYASASAVQSFSIAKATQTITFGALPDVTLPVAPFAVVATASSGLTVALSSLTPAVCTVSGSTVTVMAAGTCTIAADQPGNANYLAAAQVVRSLAAKVPWIASGSMFQPRADHTATLLNGGKVLVAGGYDASGAPTATSEIYDPATGLFTTAGSLPSKSTGHTATLLSCACSTDGKVLVVGGGNSSSQIFDPVARTWASAGGLGSNRSYHTATTLQNGKVFIVGGSDNSSKPIASTLLFDPATGSVSNGPSLAYARERHVAVLLGDGRVLISGGRAKAGNGYTVIATAEVYDPARGAISLAGAMVTGRHSADAALLADGRVLVAGGAGATDAAIGSAELYSPAAGPPGSWTVAASMAVPRADFTLTPLANGQALATGGWNASGRLASTDFYTAAIGGPGAFVVAPVMLTARSGHTATRLIDGRVLVVGGVGAAGKAIGATEYYLPAP
jgi:hypothetical protein